MKRESRNRRLTKDEIDRDRRLRALIEQEKPEIDAQVRRRMGEIRQAEATGGGGQSLGQRIRTAREARGWSQATLAASAHISQGYLSQLEQDQREPTLSIAVRVAHALELSLDDLASRALT